MTFDDWLAENEPEPPTGFECVGLERMRQVWNAAQAAEREMHLLTLTALAKKLRSQLAAALKNAE